MKSDLPTNEQILPDVGQRIEERIIFIHLGIAAARPKLSEGKSADEVLLGQTW